MVEAGKRQQGSCLYGAIERELGCIRGAGPAALVPSDAQVRHGVCGGATVRVQVIPIAGAGYEEEMLHTYMKRDKVDGMQRIEHVEIYKVSSCEPR